MRSATVATVVDQQTERPSGPGRHGVSETLRLFTEELPFERRPILEFVTEVARSMPGGARVLDVGAGDAPYRELFVHTDYRTNDWTQSVHPGAERADFIGSADSLPVADGSMDLVLCTQVLEHVPEPAKVLRECHRVLVAGGQVAVTVPLLWELHELPHDYYRYTGPGLEHLLVTAGFEDVVVAARGDAFSTIAQLLHNLGWAMGDADDGLTNARIEARGVLQELSRSIAELAPLDAAGLMPLGYTGRGRRP